MKLTVLLDNNTLIDKYFLGEPGLSIFIEDNGKKILFDTGYSDALIKNALKMNIDLKNIDFIVLSHGHNDHSWGLEPLIEFNSNTAQKIKTNLIAHPLSFNRKLFGDEDIGSKLTPEQLSKHFKLNLTKDPLWLSEKLVFLGEIPRTNNYEGKSPIGRVTIDDKMQDDYVFDDTALVYKSNEGLVIITGCSHSGICNIIEYAKKVCGEEKIIDIIGGFHLLNPPDNLMKNTMNYLKSQNIKRLHPCHCTDLNSKIAMSKILDLKDIGVGLKLEY